jgi:TRAP-type C4-dicarboxylate transport system permease large subunit
MEFNQIVSYLIDIKEEINWFFQLFVIIIIELHSKIYSVRDSCVYYGIYLLLFGCMILIKKKTSEYRESISYAWSICVLVIVVVCLFLCMKLSW